MRWASSSARWSCSSAGRSLSSLEVSVVVTGVPIYRNRANGGEPRDFDPGSAQPPPSPACTLCLRSMALKLLLVWLINALALLALPYIVPSVQVDSFYTALIAALLLGFVNT